MTREEARTVLTVLLESAVQQDLDAVRIQNFVRYLLPLPFDREMRAASNWATTHRWASSLPDLLDACDIAPAARGLLNEAVARVEFREDDMGVMVPWCAPVTLEPDAYAAEGWALIHPDKPMPWGVEALRAAKEGRTLPAPAVHPLDAPSAPDDGDRNALAAPGARPLVSLADVASELKARGLDLTHRKNRETLKKREERHTALLKPEVQGVIDAANQKMELATRAYEMYREGIEECEAALVGEADAPGEALRPAAVRVLKQLAGKPDHGPTACVEALGEALWPGLALRALDLLPRQDDEEPKPLRSVSIHFEKARARLAEKVPA